MRAADTHIVWAAQPQDGTDCAPSAGCRDGRTDCKNIIDMYADITLWLDPVSNQSNAPIFALQEFIDYANAEQPDFVVITGDLISNGMGCDADTEASYQKFNEIISTLDVPWYAINGHQHDTRGNQTCFAWYDQYVGPHMRDWSFTVRDNVFIGISEVSNGSFNITFLNDLLDTYGDQGYKAFIFTHSAIACYDEWFGNNLRCAYNPELGTVVRRHTAEYRAVVMMSGHNHANIYDCSDQVHGLFHFTTTSTMNYPAEARIVEVEEDTIRITMSPSFSSEIDNLSLNIIEGVGLLDHRTMYGDERDRNIEIDLVEETTRVMVRDVPGSNVVGERSTAVIPGVSKRGLGVTVLAVLAVLAVIVVGSVVIGRQRKAA